MSKKNKEWYKDAIIYELHIKAFKDSNGDGVGDFGGLMEKLDYLQDLGITTIWILPFYPSPLRDDGYDISDYYTINPSYGDMEQFKLFLKEAHQRQLTVITELVINHTSDQHPWFQRARKASKDSPERNYYVWTDDPATFKDVRIIFQDFETSNWTWDPVASQYYWHRFFHHQPDLNFDNPIVQEEVLKIIDHWCKMGVDGFRLDAVPYLFEREGTNCENLPETHDFLKKLRKHVEDQFPGTLLLAEANMWPEEAASYFGKGDECQMNYHFPLMPRMFMALQREDRYPITDIFDQTPEIPAACQWAMFLRNHDELTLEMVTDEERDYMYKVYAKDPKAKINLGIRHRLAPLMENNRRKIELMNSLLFSMPGTPVIYYGDEIGMGDNFYLGDRDGVRTPMQWSPDRNAGFSNTNPHQLFLPVILDPEYNYEAVNVETQRKNTSSLFWYMKQLISMQKKYKAFGRGKMSIVNADNPKILAFIRKYEEETLLIIVNLSKFSQPVELMLDDYKEFYPLELFSKNRFPSIKPAAPYFLTMGAHSFHWFSLINEKKERSQLTEKSALTIDKWEDITSEISKQKLEGEILPAYLKRVSWFKGGQRSIYSCTIKNYHYPFEGVPAVLILAEVIYDYGLPENYLFLLSFGNHQQTTHISSSSPESVIISMKMGNEDGALFDGYFIPEIQEKLFYLLSGKNNDHKNGVIESDGKDFLKNENFDRSLSRMHYGDENNTSITLNNKYFLKMYRKVEEGTNPDVEISKYLTENSNITHIPAYLGSISWRTGKEIIVWGMMQTMIENHGEGRSYMLERVNNYIERILARNMAKFDAGKRMGKLTNPVAFDELPEEIQDLIGTHSADFSSLLGQRTGLLHLSLAKETTLADFKPEPFSIHYQRSLYSSMQSLVREVCEILERKIGNLPAEINEQAKYILSQKTTILDLLKRIYSKKMDTVKTRVHGNLQLRKVLMTGKDILLQDFGGDVSKNFSERRLKRSPVRDVSSMIRSFYYVAFEGFSISNHIAENDLPSALPFAWFWAYYMSSFFMKSYISTVRNEGLIPGNENDLSILLQTFLLESALYALKYELENRPEKSIIPLKMVISILNLSQHREP